MDDSRYKLVDSLYGPGTVGAWLLALCAVSISWTFNRSSRRKDTISVDFIAALLLPLIAAGHLLFLLIRLPVSLTEIITARDVELQQYKSAIEAPLNICETFTLVTLIWVSLCGPWRDNITKLRRLGLVVVTGLLSWAMESVMFVMLTMKGVSATETTLRRSYLLLVTTIVTGTWACLVICLMVGCLTWIISTITRNKRRQDTVNKKRRGEWITNIAHLKISKKRSDSIERAMQTDRLSETGFRRLKMLTFVTLLYAPLSFIWSFVGIPGSFLAQNRNSSTLKIEQFFLIPQSDVSMSGLDQIAALVGGVIVLLAAIRSAYRSRVDKQSASISIKRRRSI